jgi:hypothetical protein
MAAHRLPANNDPGRKDRDRYNELCYFTIEKVFW